MSRMKSYIAVESDEHAEAGDPPKGLFYKRRHTAHAEIVIHVN